jgi:hypothetical protein
MTVFVVLVGEEHHGGEIDSIHESEASARQQAAILVKMRDDDREYPWKKQVEDYWTNGCDYVLVRSYKVKPTKESFQESYDRRPK